MPTVRAQPLQLSRVQGLCDVGEVSDQYRRRARRLRHTLRNHPSRLHRSLAHLATEMDDRPASRGKSPSVLPTSPQAQRFQFMVREAMAKGSIRYSQRLEMLKTASAMGLGRFEANLILAIEQNRQKPVGVDEGSRTSGGIVTLLTIAIIQSTIVAAFWWIIR